MRVLIGQFNQYLKDETVSKGISTNQLSSKIMLQLRISGSSISYKGRSGGAKVLGKLPVPGRPTIWITVGQGLTALAVGAGGGCLDIFTLICPFSPDSPSLWETVRYRLKHCLKGPLNPKQPTNQSISYIHIFKRFSFFFKQVFF